MKKRAAMINAEAKNLSEYGRYPPGSTAWLSTTAKRKSIRIFAIAGPKKSRLKRMLRPYELGRHKLIFVQMQPSHRSYWQIALLA
jgi:hypothetical protein